MSAAEQSQTLGAEGYGEVLEGTEGRMQESGQKRADLRDKSRELAGAMEGGSSAGDKSEVIQATDDTTALFMYMTAKDADDMLNVQHRILKNLKSEINDADEQYNQLAVRIERACGGRRMGEPELLAVKNNQRAPAAAQQESISLGVIASALQKKRAIVERKEALIQSLTLFVQEDQGVMRRGYTTEYYRSIMAKRGGLTEKERADKIIFGVEGAPPPQAAAVAAEGGASSSSAAAAAPKRPAAEVEVLPAAGGGGGGAAAPLTKTGEPDKRYKAGAK